MPREIRDLASADSEPLPICRVFLDILEEPTRLLCEKYRQQNRDYVSWIECRLGERVDGGMRTVPYSQGIANGLTVTKRLESIEWFYEVGYGKRRVVD